MKRIKIDDWKPFEIEKLFTVKRPKSRSVKKYNEGEIPFVSSGNYNNGVDSYREPIDDEDLDKGNCITVSPVDGSTFYQPQDFLGRGGGGSSIMLLYNDNLNKFNGLFIASVIRESLKIKYQYNDMGSSDSIKKENILLPALDNETPDWNFMEEAMKRLETRERESTSNLTSYLNNAKLNKVDTLKWKEFIVGDLFENIKKPDVLHAREVVEDENGIPYVVRTKFNNGIKYRVTETKKMTPSPKGVISFGAENASFFYQKENFVSGRDIYYIDTRHLSEKACLFLVSCLDTLTDKYSYSYGLFPDLLKKEKIKLPVDVHGNPDWNYMEKYIEKIKENCNREIHCV